MTSNVALESAGTLIAEARDSGVELWAEGSRLRFRAPPGALSDELRSRIASSRADIVAFLQSEADQSVRIGRMAPNQLGLWFLQRLVPTSTAYNIQFSTRIHGSLDYDALGESLQVLVDRHEALRTNYAEIDGEAKRVVRGRIPVSLVVSDLRGFPPEDVSARVNSDYHCVFDVETDALFRAHAYETDGDSTVLLLVAHHLVLDGTALFLLVQELFGVYEAITSDSGIPPPMDAATFSEFVEWQYHALDVDKEDSDYWHKVLDPFPEPLDLPTDRPRQEIRAMHGATAWSRIDPETTQSIKAFAKQAGVTNFVVYLAMWFAFLHRIAGSEDIVIGTPVVGRPIDKFARTIGDLINMLPIRIRDFSGSNFTDLVQSVQHTFLEGFSRQDYPLPLMVERSQNGGNLGQPPFQATFALQEIARTSPLQEMLLSDGEHQIRYNGLELSSYKLDQQQGQFELSLDVWPGEDGLLLCWRYDTDIFSAATIDAWAESFAVVVESVLARPDVALADVPLLSDIAREAMLQDAQASKCDFPPDTGFLDRFSAVATSAPNDFAVLTSGGHLTYAELATSSDKLAGYLQSRDIQTGSLVGICLDRSEKLMTVLLAMSKSGAAYLPLDPAFPEARLRYMVEDSATRYVITQPDYAEWFSMPGVTLIMIDDVLAEAETAPVLTPPVISPTDPMYVIYTSGSTGLPKGVEVTRGNVDNFLNSMEKEPGLDSSDCLLAVTTLSFDISVLELFLPLMVGARLFIANKEETKDAVLLRAVLENNDITVLQATPSQWQLLFEAGWHDDKSLRALSGGEPLPPRIARLILDSCATLWNMYGPTETTIWSSCARIESEERIHIGQPIANTQLYVLDEMLRLQPVGVPGELWIGGAGVSKGYLNRKELTNERFIDSPFDVGGRIYRTGDKARWRADGTLEHLGRLDNQVKIRGFRIELGEIEARLLEYEGIENAVVSVVDFGDSDQRLVAYLVSAAETDVSALRNALTETLPGYMLPQHFMRIDAIPLTPNGKVDRKVMPKPDDIAAEQREYVAPQNEIEQAVAKLWGEILGISGIGSRDSFFDLGGHSLLAARVMARLQSIFGVSLPLRIFFESPVVAEFSSRIVAAGGRVHTAGEVVDAGRAVELVPRDGILPISDAQRRLWFLSQLEPDSAAYVMPMASRIVGKLDRDVMRRCLEEIIKRHEILRARFVAVDGKPELRLDDDVAWTNEYIDLSELTAEQRTAEVNRRLKANATMPFDLARGPLIRSCLIRTEANEHVLLTAFHHIVFDYWSAGIVSQELVATYKAFLAGQQSPLRPLPMQFVDFVAWRKREFGEGQRKQHLDYWLAKLPTEFEPMDLPVDRPRRLGDPVVTSKCTFTISPERANRIRKTCKQHGVTVSTMLLAAFQLLLHRLTGQETMLVGSPVAGRNTIEAEKLIGFFINTIVLRADLLPGTSFVKLLAQVQETVLQAYEHQDMPFEDLVNALAPERDLLRTPLFQVFFNHIAIPVSHEKVDGLAFEPFGDAIPDSKFELTLYAIEPDEALDLILVYNASLFDDARMQHTLRQYVYLLDQVAVDVHKNALSYPLDEPDRLLPDPTAELISEYDTGTLCLTGLAKYAGAPALSGPGFNWTYAELDQCSDQLARVLVKGGIKSGDVVAIYAERHPLLVCAMLSVLRSGAAFAILDSAYPDQRLADCWKAASPKALLAIEHEGRIRGELKSEIARNPKLLRLNLTEEWFASGVDAAADAVLPVVEAADLAYVAFTSGTTGGVKAVEGPHGPVAHFLNWHVSTFGLNADDDCSLLSGISHDPFLRDVFTPLWCGATLHISPAGFVREPLQLAEFLRSANVSVMHLTPAMAQLLATSMPVNALTSLRYAFFSGDVLSADTIRMLRRMSRGVTCVNFYGATETPQAMSYQIVPSGAPDLRSATPLGRGIDGVQLLVLNAVGEAAGVGERGEIVVRTRYLTRGYVGAANSESEQFALNRFTGLPQDTVYHTGDFGRYLSDGSVEYAGRIDGQVKIRGYRIEIGEVESVLRRHGEVADVAVVVHDHGEDRKQLVAYVVPSGSPGAASIRQFAAQYLPDYSVPAAIVFLDRIPMTPNGKIDRRHLPDPTLDIPHGEGESPRTESEAAVAKVFAEILNLEQIARTDNFFDLGGQSLLGAQVVARLNAGLQVNIPLRALFEAPSAALLAERLDSGKYGSGRLTRPALVRHQTTENIPISIAQERLWFLYQMAPQSGAFNLTGSIRLIGRLDVDVLSRAIDYVINRHDSLRMTISKAGNSPEQIIGAPVDQILGRIDLSGDFDAEAILKHKLGDNGSQPFNLLDGPVIRAILYVLGDDQHVLQITCHHIVSDAWSMGVFVRDLESAYNGLAEGADVTPDPLPVQYTDYSMWQREWLQEEALENLLNFWRGELVDAPPSIDLPTDFPRPAEFSHRGARHYFTLPKAATHRLEILARAENASLYMALLATFQLLLSRYSGQSDVVIGTPVANRNHPDTERLVGFFVNTLALRIDSSQCQEFVELLREVRDRCFAGFAHEELPFERLVEDLQPRRDLSRNPIFQVMFVLQNMDLPAIELVNLQAQPEQTDRTTAQFDLTLFMRETGSGLEGTIEYATDLFSAATIDRLGRHFCNLVDQVTIDASVDIRKVDFLDSEEKERLLTSFGGAEVDRMSGETVLGLFRTQVATEPNRIAVRFVDQELTYADLDVESNRLAIYLRSQGVGKESLVGLCVERGLNILTGTLGILKAGGAYVPLDPSFPADRINFMLADSGADIIVSQSSLVAPLFGESAAKLVLLDTDGSSIQKCDATLVGPKPKPSDCAYVIYTSGSTGQPKGVQIEHHSLVNFLTSMADAPGMSGTDILYAVTTLSFDISILELFLPLVQGAQVVIASSESAADGASILAELEGCSATVMQATPSTWRMMLEAGWQGSHQLTVLCGGEALPSDLKVALVVRADAVWNMYGPTETTIWSTCARMRRDDPVHIGSPIDNTQVYIVNECDQLQPIGIPGELYIGGAGVARGYLNRNDLTADRFVQSPFDVSKRLYRTGDKARWRDDGTLEHLGRLDDQVKVRGFRIELGEIESRLLEFAGIENAVANVVDITATDQRLVGYFVSAEKPDLTELRDFLAQTLPDYMLPQHFVRIQSIPLTPNGKVDRKALPAPDDTSSARGGYVPPQNDIERAVAALWGDVLGAAEIGSRDSFFELGGHSLLASRITARLEGIFGVSLPLRTFFESPVVAEFSSRIAAAGGRVSAAQNVAGSREEIELIPRDSPHTVSDGQRRLWFLNQLEPGSAAYIMPMASRIRGSLDRDLVGRCLAEIAKRHEVLRTRFVSVDGKPEARIDSAVEWTTAFTDLSGLPVRERDLEVDRLTRENASQPFDLATGPLARSSLIRTAADEHILLIAFHHIVFDYWSAGIVTEEFVELYAAGIEDRPAKLHPLEVQFVDYVAWKQRELDVRRRQHLLDYWLEKLPANFEPLDLPSDRTRRLATPVKTEKVSLRLSAEQAHSVRQFGHQQGVTVSTLLLATFQLLLHRITDHETVLVGSPVAGRNTIDAERLVGFFINTIVLRADFPEAISFDTLLKQVQETVLQAYEHQDMPFEELVNELDPERDLLRTPLFQVFFNHIAIPTPDSNVAGLTIEAIGNAMPDSKFELTLYAIEPDESLDLSFVYNASLFDEARMQGLLRQYVHLLNQVTRNMQQDIAGFQLSEALDSRPDATTKLSAQYDVSNLCLSTLGQLGEAPALSGPRGVWTYADLDQRANQLAAALVNAGIGRDQVVAIYAQRDPLLICAMLAVLRAGAAFAILDSGYPDQRLADCWRVACPDALVALDLAGEIGPELEEAVGSSVCALRVDLSDESFEAMPAILDQSGLPSVDANAAAYVAFTSGTTGGVKAVRGAHGPVAHFLNWHVDHFGLGSNDRFSLLSGISHDPFFRDVFTPLWCGACSYISEAWQLREPKDLAATLSSAEVSVMHLTPAMAQMLATSLDTDSLRSLRYAFFSGDVLSADTIGKVRRMSPDVTCVNFYGATETPQAMSFHSVPATLEELRVITPLGRGIDGVQLLVLNKAGQLAGNGEVGEIVVRTRFLTSGYIGESELTGNRFTRNPFVDDPEDTVYRTGDLGRYLPDGSVEFAGRRDGQFKIRGYRIEAGDVAAQLLEHGSVSDVAVVLHDQGEERKQLVAYVVCSQEVDSQDLHQFVAKSLPEYAVPATIIFLDSIPLTPNGKIDRKALPDPTLVAPRDEGEPPQTQSELAVAQVFGEVLGRDFVARADSFFELGGHSLLGAQVIARLSAKLDVDIPLRALFEAPSPALLGERLDRAVYGSNATVRPILAPRADPHVPQPISFAQERLWFLYQMAPQSGAFNLTGAIRLAGPLDSDALGRAIDNVVNRHDSLRMTVGGPDGFPVQVVGKAVTQLLNCIDLTEDAESASTLKSRLREEASRPFDLVNGPVIRANVYKLSENSHVLQIACHHIVSDAWSMGVFVRDLEAGYNRLVDGVSDMPEPLPVQYGDYSSWQREWLREDALDNLLTFWRGQLNDAPPSVELPTDYPRPAEFSHKGARHHFTLSKEIVNRVNGLARSEGASLYMALLATFQLLISRYSGQSDVVIGTPVANRTHPDTEGLVGFFVNTLALRLDNARCDRYIDLLREVRDRSFNAFAHQELPFERLVEDLQPRRDLSRNPVFQIMFVLQNMELPDINLKNLVAKAEASTRTTAQLDLTLFMREYDDGIEATVEYATDLFDTGTIEQFSRHFCHLLDEVAADPDTDIRQVSLLDDDERRQLLLEFNETEMALRKDETVLSLFARHAAGAPEKIAVRFADQSLSYAELDARSNSIANYLHSLGVEQDSLVGLCVERSPEMLIAALGIMKAGGAYVPLDPSFPAERLQFMLADSGAGIVVTQADLGNLLFAESDARKVCVDTDLAEIESAGTEPVLSTASARNRAYVIYTSGSTGVPKGVEIEHHSLTNFLLTMAVQPGLTEDDVLYAVTTLSFDISLLEVFLPLSQGACVVLASKESIADADVMQRELAAANATVMQATPSTWRMLVDGGWQGGEELKILCGGEALPPDLLPSLLERSREVWNMYGPTETTIWSTCTRLQPGQPIHIGKPIGNTEVYVVNAALQLQPVGVPGELLIGGEGVARGYLHREDLTSERFIQSPFGGSQRLYRTGDLGRWRADGTLEHLGRLDHQVKVRGFRIELGEIEARLGEHDAVSAAAIVLKEHRPGDQRLVAFYVPEPGTHTTVTDLRSQLKAVLPAYMVPQHFIEIDSLPLTPNGKIDRNALPDIDGASQSGDNYTAPVTEAERRVAVIWAEMLGVEKIGVHDNLFDAGGHSLLAIRVRARMEEVFGVPVTLQALTSDTLGQIAAALPDNETPGADSRSDPDDGSGRSGWRRWLRRLSGRQSQ